METSGIIWKLFDSLEFAIIAQMFLTMNYEMQCCFVKFSLDFSVRIEIEIKKEGKCSEFIIRTSVTVPFLG